MNARQDITKWLMLVWVFLTFGLPAQFVYCYGADGHVAIEYGHGSCGTTDAAGPGVASGQTLVSVLPTESQCVDIPLSIHCELITTSNLAKRYESLRSLSHNVFLSYLLDQSPDPKSCLAVYASSGLGSHDISSRSHLRSVILRI